ncbi:MAG TPA: hypothetical protein DHV30_08905 [Balneola sp.]|nr:hypothetical protein [Balneola sp.]|tara:strand:- start:44 stop:508 length:465 start_codon:yes stop_codon:yes gene_type:complete
MAKEKSQKNPYLSSYGGGYIRADQWVTEKLCALIAKKQGSELPDKFWNLPNWKSIFRRQVQMASSLLIIYDADAISSALRDKRLYNVRSFGAFSYSGFSKILDEHQQRIDSNAKEAEFELQSRDTKQIPKLHKRDNKLSRLKNIDGETRPIQSG